MIALENVTWTYPNAGAPSVRDLSLTVAPGEFVVLCGASGSGKSTLLRLLNALVPQFHPEGTLTGTVTVDGQVTTAVDLDEIGLRTGTVLQHPRRQFFTATAAEEIAFAMENFGYPRERIRARVTDRLAQLAGSVPVATRLRYLSGGQQQRVAITAASAHGPKVLLLDEPSSNLSTDAVRALQADLAALQAGGMSIVVAEHRLQYLKELADRVVLMRYGRVQTTWTRAEFARLPDAALARAGLRGDVVSAQLPAVSAAGPSVADPQPEDGGSASGLQVTGLCCRRGGRTVLAVDRATFPAGSVTAIRGANGAGKSTLARVLTGLQRCAGTVRLGGRVLSRTGRQRVSGIVMQDVQRQLFTESVRAELELAGAGDRGAGVLAEVDLDAVADRHPLSLSGGEQQRLVVAVASVAGQRVVVFDEPSSGVDRRHLRSIADQIRRLAAAGRVVLLISHDEDLLALAADAQLTLVPADPR